MTKPHFGANTIGGFLDDDPAFWIEDAIALCFTKHISLLARSQDFTTVEYETFGPMQNGEIVVIASPDDLRCNRDPIRGIAHEPIKAHFFYRTNAVIVEILNGFA